MNQLDPTICNATVSIAHSDGANGPQLIRVSIDQTQTEVATAMGGQVTSTIIFARGLDIRRSGDRMTVNVLDGWDTPPVTKPYELYNVAYIPGDPDTAHIRAEVRGYIS